MMITPDMSCGNNPTVRSEKARLNNSFLTVAGIDEALNKARITKRFPRVATTENARCKTQKGQHRISLLENELLKFM